jgi:hypothetical protein
MSFLYFARYGFLSILILVTAVLVFAHLKSNRSR